MHRNEVPCEVRNADAGEAYPEHMDAYCALAILGGEMSANDPLPSLRRAELLILDAMARGRPVIGHCLGAQLMARALGARVGPSLAPEVGWHGIRLQGNPSARHWFGDGELGPVFQWHEEAFELPAGAMRLASSDACMHQAFAIGPHLAMQFHVEVDADKLRQWSMLDSQAYQALQQRHATVHSGPTMRAGMAEHLAGQQALADRVYACWLAGVGGRRA